MHADEARLEGVTRREEEAAARRAELDAEQRRLLDEAASLAALREALEAEREAVAAEAQVLTRSCIFWRIPLMRARGVARGRSNAGGGAHFYSPWSTEPKRA